MKKHKGQAVVEFAVVLPLFLLVLFGIIYSGMLFYDYSVLSNLARSGAREAAIVNNVSSIPGIQTYYQNKITNNTSSPLITSLYTPKSSEGYLIEPEDGTDWSKGVKVTITMQRNQVPILVDMVLPDEYKIQYFMKRDEQPSSS